jgi:hypothetical protein
MPRHTAYVIRSEGKVPLDDPFPIHSFGLRIRESILDEFGGRCPTVQEVAGIPDSLLLKLPGMGPTSLRKLRSATHGLKMGMDAIEQWSNARLLSERNRLLDEIQHHQDEFRRQQSELRRRLDSISIELRLRRVPLNSSRPMDLIAGTADRLG